MTEYFYRVRVQDDYQDTTTTVIVIATDPEHAIQVATDQVGALCPFPMLFDDSSDSGRFGRPSDDWDPTVGTYPENVRKVVVWGSYERVGRVGADRELDALRNRIRRIQQAVGGVAGAALWFWFFYI